MERQLNAVEHVTDVQSSILILAAYHHHAYEYLAVFSAS